LMWQVQPVVLIVGSPAAVAPRVTDTEIEAPEALASKLPWSWTGKTTRYLMRQSPCTDRAAPDRLQVRPLPGLTVTDVDGR